MCLAFIANEVVPDVPVMLLFNRDEDYERISLPVQCWSDAPHIIGGFDVSTRGTWAAVRRDGRFGMLTFVREPRLAITPSRRRGQIVREFMLGNTPVREFAAMLEAEPETYLGYNVVLGEPGTVIHYNNRSRKKNVLEKGIYGVSNADLETPWFKLLRGKKRIESLLERAEATNEALFKVLEDRTPAPDTEVQVTGLSFERERAKSPPFITLPDYGTRSSSIVRLFRSGAISFQERTFAQGGRKTHEVDIRIEG